ncbi:MAG: hypothetical protein ACREIA_22230 [Opitutaceae bacterium]
MALIGSRNASSSRDRDPVIFREWKDVLERASWPEPEKALVRSSVLSLLSYCKREGSGAIR